MARNIGAGGRKKYKDFSVPINNALNDAVGDFQAHSGDFMWFYDMVKTGATWDIKLKDKWNALIGAWHISWKYKCLNSAFLKLLLLLKQLAI